MADWDCRIYEVYFSILAASTLALASMMVAYETLFWMAADCMFFWVSALRMRSGYNIFYLWWRCVRCRVHSGKVSTWRTIPVAQQFCPCALAVPGRCSSRWRISWLNRTFLWWTSGFFRSRFLVYRPVCRGWWRGSRPWPGCSWRRCPWWWPTGGPARRRLFSNLPGSRFRCWGWSGGNPGSADRCTFRRTGGCLLWR